MASAESVEVSSDEDEQFSTTPSQKRKSSITEIEVDLDRPEPPSKKARRALKKGKPLPPRPASNHGDQPDQRDKEAPEKPDVVTDGLQDSEKASKKKVRSPYGVWIGNLPFTTTRKELRGWLVARSDGTIADEAIARVHIPKLAKGDRGRGKEKGGREDRNTDKDADADAEASKDGEGRTNKGFAYVDFTSVEAHVAALGLSETDMGGRRLLIKDSRSFEGRPQTEPQDEKLAGNGTAWGNGDSAAAGPQPSRKVFVGNLGFTTDEDDLWAHFAKCGAIEWVKVATFEDTGKCKGFGWVKFQESAAAAWAVKGFVKIKEQVPWADGDRDQEEGAGGSGEERAQVADRDGKRVQREGETKVKKRKWWVNTLKGRALKIELAEDDQVRYKKRFGKDPAKRQKGLVLEPERKRPLHGRVTQDTVAKTDAESVAQPPDRADMTAARLMGTAVASQGKKTTLE